MAGHDPDVVPGALVVPTPRTRAGARAITRDRLIDAAVELTIHQGWGTVTMAKLAEHAQVSRQTVYNEIGTKAELAEAMILREVERLLDCLTRAFEAYPDDVVRAIHDASYAVMQRAEGNELLRAIVCATHGADTQLLPLLTSHSIGLLGVTRGLVRENLEPSHLDRNAGRLDTAIDTVVRVMLSHVMQPSYEPGPTADCVAWVAARVLLPEFG
jgi:AcrR family transcriptional regulator